ncbi:MAG: DUF4253 domain-containing protein [Woeseiaceae bacterium]|nr:DUF4253 domain-containing protein [Woeseiaceae bacterium]
MNRKAAKTLLRAVLEPRRPGALQAIAHTIEVGADPNAVLPETSTSSGPVRRGSTLVDESKRKRIQALLEEYGADRQGEHIGSLARAIVGGDVKQAESLVQSDSDLRVLATFRVDLVGHQIRGGNETMLELLLQRGMTSSSTHLLNAIRNRLPGAVDLLLRYGQRPERPDEDETPLMTAAGMGDMDMVRRLVEGGADVNRSADESGEWTPSFYARQSGHEEVARWLQARMNEAALRTKATIDAGRDPKYALLFARATAGDSLSTDDIVKTLVLWDERYGVAVLDATADSLSLEFEKLPKDMPELLEAVRTLCPDASDGEEELVAQLRADKTLSLWWD